MMKEKPIIFSFTMIKAILENRKTQTRRVIKSLKQLRDKPSTNLSYQPFQVGMILWVKETWTPCDETTYYTKADTQLHHTDNPNCKIIWLRRQPPERFPDWIPSIFMPRWASRITLEITDVRVERLQEITTDDIDREGCDYIAPADKEVDVWADYRKWFINLWDSINAKRGYGWDKNSWVFVISFKRIK